MRRATLHYRSVRLVSRAVLREIWPPFLLGFVAYTFVLLIRTILFLADFAVRRSAPFLEVAKLVALSLPWIVVLTLPMAFLLGVLIGLGRLSADSELTALGACGVGPASLYTPVLGAAAALSLVVLFLYNASCRRPTSSSSARWPGSPRPRSSTSSRRGRSGSPGPGSPSSSTASPPTGAPSKASS